VCHVTVGCLRAPRPWARQRHPASGSLSTGSVTGHPRRPVTLPNSARRTLVGYWLACVPGASVSGACQPVWQDSGPTASRLPLVMVTTATVSMSWSPGTRLGAIGIGGNSRSVATVTVSPSCGGTGYRRTEVPTPSSGASRVPGAVALVDWTYLESGSPHGHDRCRLLVGPPPWDHARCRVGDHRNSGGDRHLPVHTCR
jgi:hypothetical protein